MQPQSSSVQKSHAFDEGGLRREWLIKKLRLRERTANFALVSRKKAGVTYEQLEVHLKIPKKTYQNWEQALESPRAFMFFRAMNYFGSDYAEQANFLLLSLREEFIKEMKNYEEFEISSNKTSLRLTTLTVE